MLFTSYILKIKGEPIEKFKISRVCRGLRDLTLPVRGSQIFAVQMACYLIPFPFLTRKASSYCLCFLVSLDLWRSYTQHSCAVLPLTCGKKVIMQKTPLAPKSGMPSSPVHLTLPSFPNKYFSLMFLSMSSFCPTKKSFGRGERLVREGEASFVNTSDNGEISMCI